MKNFRQHMSNIHPCLLEYLDSMSKSHAIMCMQTTQSYQYNGYL